MKLQEGNVFTDICSSFILSGGNRYIICTMGHVTWCGNHCPGHQSSPGYLHPLLLTSGSNHRRPIQNCSVVNVPHQYWHLVVATKTHTAGKWAVCILLECCFVWILFFSSVWGFRMDLFGFLFWFEGLSENVVLSFTIGPFSEVRFSKVCVVWRYFQTKLINYKTVWVILVPIIKYYLYTCQRWRVYILFVLLKNLPDSTEYFWSSLHIVIILLITSFPRREDCKILYYSVLSSVTGFVIYPFVFCNLPLSWMWNQWHTCQWQVEQFSSYRKDEDTKQSLRWNHQ